MSLKVNEIFYSLQGEGVLAGEPTTFIRLQGCNLEKPCSWCDTLYSQDSSEGKEMSIEDVLEETRVAQPITYKHWVCITGGEPLLQESELHELVKKLKAYGFRVEIETNGTLPKPQWWSKVDSWCADIKCPSSGIESKYISDWFNVRSCDQVKLVVKDNTDIEYAKSILRSNILRSPSVLISPVMDGVNLNSDWLVEVSDFCKEFRIRLSLQIHKIIWGNKKGV